MLLAGLLTLAGPSVAVRISSREDTQLGAVIDKVLEVHLQRQHITKSVYFPFPTFKLRANLTSLLTREGCPRIEVNGSLSAESRGKCRFARLIDTALSDNARFERALTQLIGNLTKLTEHIPVPTTQGVEILRDSAANDPPNELELDPRASVPSRTKRQLARLPDLITHVLGRDSSQVATQSKGRETLRRRISTTARACSRAERTAPSQPALKRHKRLAIGLARLFGIAPVEQVDALDRQEWNTEKHVVELYNMQVEQGKLVQQVVGNINNETKLLEEEIRLILNTTMTGVTQEIENETSQLEIQITYNHVLQHIKDHQLGSYERVLAVRQLIMQAMYHLIPTALASITTDTELLEALDYARVWVKVNHTGATIWIKTSRPMGPPTEIFLITTIPIKLPGASHYVELMLHRPYVARLPDNITVALTTEAYTLCEQHRPLCGGGWFITGLPSSCAEAIFERNLPVMNNLCKTELKDFHHLPFVKTLIGGRLLVGNVDRYSLSCRRNNSYHTTERLVEADLIFQVPCQCHLTVAGRVFVSSHGCQPELGVWEISSLLPYASYLSDDVDLSEFQFHLDHNTTKLYESRPLIRVNAEALRQLDSTEIRLSQLSEIMEPDPSWTTEFQLPSVRYIHQYLGVIFQVLAVAGAVLGMLSLFCICRLRRRLQILNLCLLPSMLHGVKAGGIWKTALPPLRNPTEVAGLVTVNLALLVTIISILLLYLAAKCVARLRQGLTPGDWYELWLTLRNEGTQVHLRLGKTRYSGPVDLMLAMSQISRLHASRCIVEVLRKGIKHTVKLDFPDVGPAPCRITLNAARGIHILIQEETSVNWSVHRQVSNLLYRLRPDNEDSLRCQLHLMNGRSTYVAVRVNDTAHNAGSPSSSVGSERDSPAGGSGTRPVEIPSTGPLAVANVRHFDECDCDRG